MKYIRLPNGSKMECYDCIITGGTCLIKFVNAELDIIKAFLGSGIIDYIDLLDEDEVLIRTCDIYAKRRQILLEETTIPHTEHRIVRSAYTETVPAVIDEETGNVIQPARVIEHPDETEPITRQIPANMITAVLEKPGIKEEIENLKQAVGITDPNQMTLEEFKDYYIRLSKDKLDRYLTENPLVSDCHNDIESTYSITKEKQNLMAVNYVTYMVKKQFDPDTAVLTWNESGDICEKWKEKEFWDLITEVDRVVKPLVLWQQILENRIRRCTSLEQVKKISFDYSVSDIRNGAEIPIHS